MYLYTFIYIILNYIYNLLVQYEFKNYHLLLVVYVCMNYQRPISCDTLKSLVFSLAYVSSLYSHN